MNLANRYDKYELSRNKDQIKKVFFYRICGTGMGAAATLFKEAGFDVHGADSAFYPPMGTYLKNSGIPLMKISDVTADYLKKFDLIVVGNVIPKGGEDATMIENCGVPFTSFPEAMGELILSTQNVVGIAGTHGKTTTTYFMTQIFEKLGKNPGYFIGGVIDGRPSSKLGAGNYFFIESDEYDSAYFEKVAKLRHYQISHLIVTSLEYDHADIYDDFEELRDEFREVIKEVTETLIFSGDYSGSRGLMNEFQSVIVGPTWLSYGLKTDFGPFIDEMIPTGSKFRLKFNNQELSFSTNLVGRHNILNLTSCLLFALNEGFSAEELNAAIKDLKMVKRRQELRGHYKNVAVIDDFAHHPRAIEETLNALSKLYPDTNLLVVLDPASATARSALFQDEYVPSLVKAHTLIMAKPARSTTVKHSSDLDVEKLVKEYQATGRKAYLAKTSDEIRSAIDESIAVNPNSTLAILSNSTCLGLWESSFVNEIK